MIAINGKLYNDMIYHLLQSLYNYTIYSTLTKLRSIVSVTNMLNKNKFMPSTLLTLTDGSSGMANAGHRAFFKPLSSFFSAAL